MQNIMMMFAIHNARRDWDPLPTAYKLRDLEDMFVALEGRYPTEAELAELASITRGEVRRLKKLLALPAEYREELMAELEKPRSEQQLTVDHVLEATKGAEALVKRGVLDPQGEERLRRAVVDKFRDRTLNSTVEPRKLARIARAVERDEISPQTARLVVNKIVDDPEYTIDDAFRDSAARADAEHAIELLLDRVTSNLGEYRDSGSPISQELGEKLEAIRRLIDELLERG
jgi:ParB family transcriptional regulator, chromosome partitioning protein